MAWRSIKSEKPDDNLPAFHYGKIIKLDVSWVNILIIAGFVSFKCFEIEMGPDQANPG